MIKQTLSILGLLFLACSTVTDWTLAAGNVQPQRTGIPTVPLCDLLRYSSKYKNRIVRVRAVYNSWFEGSELRHDCNDAAGAIWAYFPDSAYSQSKPEVAERLEDVFYRPLLDDSGQPSGMFNSWETELVVTGRISWSKKKAFGIHGGFAYHFAVATVEEIGTPHIYDHQSGKKTTYISESQEQRRARHEKEAASVCESNSIALEKILTEFQSPHEKITLVGHLGSGEQSSGINGLRLAAIRNYLINCAGVESERVIVREGERGRFEGRVTVYRANELSKILLAGRDMNICLRPCDPPPNKGMQRTRN